MICRIFRGWIIPVQTLWAWMGIQCLLACLTISALQHYRPMTGNALGLFVLEVTPGVLILCRWVWLAGRALGIGAALRWVIQRVRK
jgi:hypothetical protein